MKKEPSKNRRVDDEKKENMFSSWQPGMVLFARLSGWIAFPVIAALFLGRWLDRRYDTEPVLLLVTVGVAFFVTSVGIAKEATKSFKEIEEAAKKEKEDEKKKQD